MKVSREQVIAVIKEMARAMEENKTYLTQLDSAIGDGDHGINMHRGFKKVLEKMPEVEDQDIGTLFRTAGMSLVSAVGGAAGPLYGTYFMQWGKVAQGKDELSNGDFLEMLQAGLEGIKQRGKAQVGEKTMVDALEPAVQAFQEADQAGEDFVVCLQAAVEAAIKGRDSTVDMVARKGRASYLGERSRGHQDPGATSSVLLLESMQRALEG